jgi:hypothetical protein
MRDAGGIGWASPGPDAAIVEASMDIDGEREAPAGARST